MKKIIFIVSFFIVIVFSSCAVRLLGVLATEEVAAIRLLGARATATSVVLESEAALASNLARVRIIRKAGARSRIYFKMNGRSASAELLDQSTIRWTKSGAIHNIPGKFYTINNSSAVRIRTGPGTSYPVYGMANPNRVVILLDESAGWSKVQLNNTFIGWVKNIYLLAAAAYSEDDFASGNGAVVAEKKRNEKTVKTMKCGKCNGRGAKHCTTCSGTGTKQCTTCWGTGYRDCRTCYSTGRKSCLQCRGNGQTTCSVCRGNSNVTCRTCRGTGYRGAINGVALTCFNCRGVGSFACSNGCSGGALTCNACAGRGDAMCLTCNGKASFICSSCNGAGQFKCSSCTGVGQFNCNACDNLGSVSFTVLEPKGNIPQCYETETGNIFFYNSSLTECNISLGYFSSEAYRFEPIIVIPGKSGIGLYQKLKGNYRYMMWFTDASNFVKEKDFYLQTCNDQNITVWSN